MNKAITNFGTGSSKLSPKAKKFLIEMAHYLKKNAKLWKTVDVSGHTDIRGTLAFNMSLSRARARSVREALLLGGLSPKKVKVAGFGPKMPIDPRRNHKAYAKNRRVEIRFSGVKNASTLTRGITKIKKRIVSRTTIHASR